ncbi:terpenoid cyclases/protein prenyltransferase alpha-alpha toroid [Cladochytrium replicatum]|nr:terpenoid cyclases/protein prenyltransferase alpha-alpha toroid [Cladochytrium replicatum]
MPIPSSDSVSPQEIANALGLPDDGIKTQTSQVQAETELSIAAIRLSHPNLDSRSGWENVKLNRAAHVRFVMRGLPGLSEGFTGLDASKPWLIYWMLHALELMSVELSEGDRSRVVSTLATCQHPDGGFGGGHGQISHLATTYAAIHALAILGTEEAYRSVRRDELYRWMLRMKQPDGSFVMHDGGESDVRGSYCALAVAKMMGITTPELTDKAGDFVASCQTYEGGISAYPGLEAHGGYTFCGLAALAILDRIDAVDVKRLTAWAAASQFNFEGGFQGRTNKLVDGCYAFWQGGVFPILEAHFKRKDPRWSVFRDDRGVPHGLFDRVKLQEYLLLCCQDARGGLRDKPGKRPDYYHTCYCLSGMSCAQNYYTWDDSLNDIRLIHATETMLGEAGPNGRSAAKEADTHWEKFLEEFREPRFNSMDVVVQGQPIRTVTGSIENILQATHPVYNIRIDKVFKWQQLGAAMNQQQHIS